MTQVKIVKLKTKIKVIFERSINDGYFSFPLGKFIMKVKPKGERYFYRSEDLEFLTFVEKEESK